ncbi:hypothetical protein [Helicobacter pylori]|uniref:hypothetical protein n=1 Tax=Helicobacter pylori TaxID=210 RepID=UPI001F0889DF|nr:hypothetical protein [Helicobacter pylori]
MAYLKCMGEWGKKTVFAVSLTCFLANTIHAEDNKPTLKEICVKAVKTCDGYSEKIDYYSKLSPFQKCLANTVEEAQKTGWDTAGEVATEVAKGVGTLVLGAFKVTGYLLKGAANMLFSKEREFCMNVSDKKSGKICWTEPTTEDDSVYSNEMEMDMWKKQREEAEEVHKKIARDKAILASCWRVLKG